VCPFLKSIAFKVPIKRGLMFGGGISSTNSISTLSLSFEPEKLLYESLGSMSFAVDNKIHVTSGGSSSSGESLHCIHDQ